MCVCLTTLEPICRNHPEKKPNGFQAKRLLPTSSHPRWFLFAYAAVVGNATFFEKKHKHIRSLKQRKAHIAIAPPKKQHWYTACFNFQTNYAPKKGIWFFFTAQGVNHKLACAKPVIHSHMCTQSHSGNGFRTTCEPGNDHVSQAMTFTVLLWVRQMTFTVMIMTVTATCEPYSDANLVACASNTDNSLRQHMTW